MKRVALIGAGDLGRTVRRHVDATPGKTAVGFIDDTKSEPVDEIPILGGLADVERLLGDGAFDAVLITIGYRHLDFRAALYDRLVAAGVPFDVQVHPSCVLAEGARVEPGSILFPGCVLDDGAVVRANTLLNTGCIIAHDSSIGPHSFAGPGVTFAGFIDVQKCCFLGVGTVLIDNLTLGDHTQTGGGAVVVRSFAGDGLLVGVPAKERDRGA